jgi:putative flippase GtrA
MALHQQVPVFLLSGALATSCHFATMALLVEKAYWAPLPASCMGAMVGALVSYWLNYHLTFKSVRRHSVAMPRFFVAAAIAFLLNAGLLAVLLSISGVHYLPAQFITTALVLLFTYSASKFWAFK